jgi:hypothetical protein
MPVVRSGAPGALPEPTTTADGTGYAALFREGLSALGPILERALEPATLEALSASPRSDGTPRIPDELWAAVVRELAVAHRRAVVSRDHLLRAAVPVYLGRVASFVTELAGLDPAEAEGRLEALCVHFERSRSELLALWTAHAR